MTQIAAVTAVLPPHQHPQSEITDALVGAIGVDGASERRMRRLHAATRIDTRSLAVPLERYASLGGFGEANALWNEVATELGEAAVKQALDEAGISPHEVDLFAFTTVTGLSVPSLEARLAPRLGLRPDVRRLPLFGLGCVAGASGLARVHDHLAGAPEGVAVLLSVELCSLTVQRSDTSVPNLVASGLFGDGAAAVVLVGDARAARRDDWRGPRVVASRSRLHPDTEDVLGWDIGGSGFKIVLGASIADLVRGSLPGDVEALLGEHGLGVGDVTEWLAHPGGPKVLLAAEEVLGLPAGGLARSWESLRTVGNLSSASVLHLLRDAVHDPGSAAPAQRRGSGEPWVVLAFGPGFSSELVLLQW